MPPGILLPAQAFGGEPRQVFALVVIYQGAINELWTRDWYYSKSLTAYSPHEPDDRLVGILPELRYTLAEPSLGWFVDA